MSRNLKNENLKKLAAIEVNGYRYDLANYMYNPSYEYDYPSLKKVLEETDDYYLINRLYYFKHYDGSGEYYMETYKHPKDNNNGGWSIIKDKKETKLQNSNRFSRKVLEDLAKVN